MEEAVAALATAMRQIAQTQSDDRAAVAAQSAALQAVTEALRDGQDSTRLKLTTERPSIMGGLLLLCTLS